MYIHKMRLLYAFRMKQQQQQQYCVPSRYLERNKMNVFYCCTSTCYHVLRVLLQQHERIVRKYVDKRMLTTRYNHTTTSRRRQPLTQNYDRYLHRYGFIHLYHTTTAIQHRFFWSNRSDTTTSNTNSDDVGVVPPNISKGQNDVLSKYDILNLEEYIHEPITNEVFDPILGKSLKELQWLHKRITISYSNNDSDSNNSNNNSSNDDNSNSNSSSSARRMILTLQLRIPSLLYPKINELQQLIQNKTIQRTQKWLLNNKNISQIPIEAKILPVVQPPLSMMSRIVLDQEEFLRELGPGLNSVSHIIAVYSCKGGVGKSTVAVNVAYELARMGGRIGLLDLDIYGPSLPVLVKPVDSTIRRSPIGNGLVYPILHKGVKLLSLGYVNTNSGVPGSGQNNGASIMKGPMTVKVVSQLLKGTDWGSLDVLLLDLPPGTGDVQIAVLQQIQLSGAIAVTTPSKLATTDTHKGIEMFTSLGVPTMAVVENMAYFDDDTGKRHYPFGKGLSDLTTKVNIIQLPIATVTNDANDNGIPLTVSRPKESSIELCAYQKLSHIVAEELLRVQYGVVQDEMEEFVSFDNTTTIGNSGDEIIYFNVSNVHLSLNKLKGDEKFIVRIYNDNNAINVNIPSPSELRSRDPRTGDVMLDSPYLKSPQKQSQENPDGSSDPTVTITKSSLKRSPSVIPVKVERRGRYGWAVEWADGATIIYSMKAIAKAAGGIVKN